MSATAVTPRSARNCLTARCAPLPVRPSRSAGPMTLTVCSVSKAMWSTAIPGRVVEATSWPQRPRENRPDNEGQCALTRTTISVRGPCTPSTRCSSMSLVADGPLIIVSGAHRVEDGERPRARCRRPGPPRPRRPGSRAAATAPAARRRGEPSRTSVPVSAIADGDAGDAWRRSRRARPRAGRRPRPRRPAASRRARRGRRRRRRAPPRQRGRDGRRDLGRARSAARWPCSPRAGRRAGRAAPGRRRAGRRRCGSRATTGGHAGSSPSAVRIRASTSSRALIGRAPRPTAG